MRISISIAIVACLLLNNCSKKTEPGLLISQAKCTGLENPEGIGAVPDFSWILKANQRGQIQSAYQIIVGSDSDIIRNHPGTIWDSGKILSEESAWIPYQDLH
jgi:alpha-L-rhamnosidase